MIHVIALYFFGLYILSLKRRLAKAPTSMSWSSPTEARMKKSTSRGSSGLPVETCADKAQTTSYSLLIW